MKYDVRQMLNQFTEGLSAVGKTHHAEVGAFLNLLNKTYATGALDTKTKEIISIAVSVFSRCEYCIVYHVDNALKAGASKEEIMESAMVAVAFGGGPSMAYTVTLLEQSVTEFSKDYQ